jgi:hypothetical protein
MYSVTGAELLYWRTYKDNFAILENYNLIDGCQQTGKERIAKRVDMEYVQ